MPQKYPEIYLVSACLVGLCTRYDSRLKPDEECIRKLSGRHWVPVCPEQLGGLPTPRAPADLVGGDGNDVLAGRARVVTRDGVDVTSHFIGGARQCLGTRFLSPFRLSGLRLQHQRARAADVLVQ